MVTPTQETQCPTIDYSQIKVEYKPDRMNQIIDMTAANILSIFIMMLILYIMRQEKTQTV